MSGNASDEEDLSEEYPAGSDYAYVCMIFGGDKYVKGALTLAESIIQSKSTYDRVCLYTADVSDASIKQLNQLFTHVILVDEISVATIPMKSEKQNKIYNWINRSFTKWNCLRLTQYKKILFCDCDFIFLENCDNLFNLKTPAATFSSPWADFYLHGKNRNGIQHPYLEHNKEPLHGSMISSDAIKDALDTSFVCYGSLVLLRPSINHFGLFQRWIIRSQPYGHRGISGFDEQSLAEFYITEMNRKWYNIHQQYNYCPRKTHWLKNNIKPKAYHYIGSNPWEHPRDKWDDTKAWWKIYDSVEEKLRGPDPN